MGYGDLTDGFRTSPSGGAAAPPFTMPKYKFASDISFDGDVDLYTNRYKLVEQFKRRPALNAVIQAAFTDADATAAANTNIKIAASIANPDFEVLGTNMTTALCTFCTTRGGIRMTTAGADNDQGILTPHLDTNMTSWASIKWGTENQTVWEAIITTGDDVATGVLYWAGLKLTNTPVVATDDDQVFFRFSTDDADTNWEVVYSIGGTDATADSGVAVAASTQYKLRIEIDDVRKAHFFINNVEVAISTALTNDIDLIPYIGIQALSGTAEFIEVQRISLSRIFYE